MKISNLSDRSVFITAEIGTTGTFAESRPVWAGISKIATEMLARLNLRTGLSLMTPSLVAELSAESVSKLIQDISQKEFPMRVIFETSRLFALVAVFGLMAAGSGCAKPDAEEGGASALSSDLGAEAGSSTGGGAEVPEGGEEEGGSEEPAEGEGEAPAEGEGDAAAPAEGDAAAPAEGDAAAPAEGDAAAETEAPAKEE
jgi:hypothetical protein